jgi:hypothetical protein
LPNTIPSPRIAGGEKGWGEGCISRRSVDRTLQPAWLEDTFAPDVVMTAPDPAVNAMVFGPAAPVQVAAGSMVTDADGTRQSVAIIPSGTEAVVEWADGSSEPLTNLTVRITEYTVGERGPEAMPAELPPTSAYTYAFAVTADEVPPGTGTIQLSRPVPVYVDNFLVLDGGAIVPLGRYEREKKSWVAQPNGVVLDVLGVDGEGRAELDTDGDGVADDAVTLGTRGITDEERQVLALRYGQNKSLWRMVAEEVFMRTFDGNHPVLIPPDAVLPNGGPPEGGAMGATVQDADTSADGSIDFLNQSLAQNIMVVGVPYGLSYRSDHQLDREAVNRIVVPLSGASVPASLRRIDVEVLGAGRQWAASYDPLPNQSYTFEWDGRDGFGRLVQGRQGLEITVKFVYPIIRGEAAEVPLAFGQSSVSQRRVTELGAVRGATTSVRKWRGAVGGWDAKAEEMGGWTLAVQKQYDPLSRVLGGGYGSDHTPEAIGPTIRTVAGAGAQAYPADGIPATQSGLIEPGGRNRGRWVRQVKPGKGGSVKR